MPRIPNVQRRGGTYWFRCRVPADIVESYGKIEVKESLRTKAYDEAKTRALEKRLEVEADFKRHRQQLASLANGGSGVSVAGPAAQITAAAHYQAVILTEDRRREQIYAQVEGDLDGFLREGKYVPHPRDEGYYRVSQDGDWEQLLSYCLRGETKARLKELRRALTVGNFRAHKALAGGDLTLARSLLRAEIKALESILAEAGAFGPAEPSVSAEEIRVDRSPARLISVAASDWISAKSAIWPEKTRLSREAHIRQLVGVCGDKPIDQYSKADVRDFKSVLASLPPNWSKQEELRDLGLRAAAAKAARLGLTPCHPKTVNNILDTCASCFNWLLRTSDEVSANPFSGIRVEFREDARSERDPFTARELAAISASKAFSALDRNSASYWVPLIALFSGMRLQEICQLRGSDIRADENGIWYFDNNTNTPDKKLKSVAARRRIPIHPVLLELQFLKFAELRGVKGRLFPECTMSKDGYYSTNFSKRYGHFLEKVGIKRPTLSFHSYRHTFEDAARAAQIDHSVMSAIQGHVEGDMSDRYGSGYPLTVLADALLRISYPGIDAVTLR